MSHSEAHSEAHSVYELKLHEEMKEGNMNIIRVPGGWIYSLTYTINYTGPLGTSTASQGFVSSVFVPYSEATRRDHGYG